MSNIQLQPQMNSQDEFDNGIWKLWPLSVIARSLRKNQQSLEMRVLQLNEQQESLAVREETLQKNQQSLEMRLLKLNEQQELLAVREETLSQALRKVEQISLQHQQNNNVETDRLEQKIESLANRSVDALSAHRLPHASTLENPKKLPSPQNLIPVNKCIANESASQSGASEGGYLLEAALNSMQKDIRALQVHARAQAMRVNVLATFAGEPLPNLAGGDLSPAQPFAEDLKRLSTRERNIALQLKQLSDAER
jgi:hypothetical protein